MEEMLFVTLKYLRQYPTMKELAFEYDVAESTVHRTITWVEVYSFTVGNSLYRAEKCWLNSILP
ncbi:helix-turn-helix domain-containing protein [Bacillus thuringiensis]|uniref:helix-turn-helix domain-containing protein n=1 Tax=Bacillus cereus group TaxID=86661 RepID=UPI003B9818AE